MFSNKHLHNSTASLIDSFRFLMSEFHNIKRLTIQSIERVDRLYMNGSVCDWVWCGMAASRDVVSVVSRISCVPWLCSSSVYGV